MAVFENAGRRDGLEIWRIENFSPVPFDPKEYGKFYDGDSYVILRTCQLGKSFKWNIHFWLGRHTTSDESGSAAILAVELDDSLGGDPVQYREVQGHESQLFLSYFPSGVRYLPGGVNSGFTHVNPNEPDPNEPKKLYQVKGKRNVRVRQVKLGIESMNNGDCFILDTGDSVYVYHGSKSKRTERLKAISAGNQIRDQDHAGRSTVKILDEFSDADELDEFFRELGSGSAATVPDESTADSDESFEIESSEKPSLFKVSDASGKMNVEKLAEKPLSRSMLRSEDCFILDTVTSGIYAWVGKGSTKKEKEEAIRKSEEFITLKNYPQWTRITRVVEGGEPSTFKEYFADWAEYEDGLVITPKLLHFNADKPGDEIFDYKKEDLASDEVFELRFGEEVYVWIGESATEEERAAVEEYYKHHDGGSCTIIHEGSEPEHFKAFFADWND